MVKHPQTWTSRFGTKHTNKNMNIATIILVVLLVIAIIVDFINSDSFADCVGRIFASFVGFGILYVICHFITKYW